MLGHNCETNSNVIENPMMNFFIFHLLVLSSILKTEAINTMATGKKNEIGKTILSGNLKKNVIAITNTQLKINETNDRTINLIAVFMVFSTINKIVKTTIIKRDE